MTQTTTPTPDAATARRSRTAALAVAVIVGVGLAGLQLVLPGRWGQVVPVVAVMAAGVVLAVIDARTHRLPNAWTLPVAAAGLVQAVVVFTVSGDLAGLAGCLGAAAIVFVAYTLMAAAGWFGFGDAKAAGALALLVGIPAGLFAIYLVPLAVLCGGLWRLATRAGRQPQPHGPALALASLALVVAAAVVR